MDALWSPRLAKNFLIACAIALFGWQSSQFSALDRIFSDLIQSKRPLAASGNIIVIDVDRAAISSHGGHFVPRPLLADALQRLQADRAARVYIDVLLDTPRSSASDRALEAALRRFDRQRIAIGAIAKKTGFSQRYPLKRFSDHATVVEMSLFPDRDGWMRAIDGRTTQAPWLPNPARWLVQAYAGANEEKADKPGEAGDLARAVRINRRIAPQSVNRIAIGDYIKAPPEDLSDHLVIIATPEQAPGGDANYPFYGELDRGRLIALGTQTLLGDVEPRDSHPLVHVAIALGIIVVTAVSVMRARSKRYLSLCLVGILVLVAGGSFLALMVFDIPLAGFRLLPAISASAIVFMIYRFGIAEVLSEFLSGDLSPEEIWTWRAYQHHNEAAVLAGIGTLKRANDAARQLGLVDADEQRVRSGDVEAAFECALKGDEQPTILLEIDGRTRHFKLVRPVRGVPIILFNEITDQREREAILRTLAQTDRLTGIANRSGLEVAINGLTRQNIPYAIVLLDLNGFKAVNDTYGHLAGDQVIVAATKRFQSVIRANDTIARLGGDEFAVVLPKMTRSGQLDGVARALERSLAEPFFVDGKYLRVGVAAGTALSTGETSMAAVLAQADKQMYARKNHLKNGLIHEIRQDIAS